MGILESGTALGANYRLVDQVGSGAAGEVWRVSSQEPLDLAAKILKPEHVENAGVVERFVRERSVLLSLQHDNIVTVRDLVVEGDVLAIVMDFVPGGSLRDLLATQKTLTPSSALLLCSQVLFAVAHAHSKGVTHRDIKPDNVLLAQPWDEHIDPTVKVTDFGVAAVVSDGRKNTSGLHGTPEYMAPELISQGQTTPAADVYAVGIMLYEFLAGHTPFSGPGTDFTVAYRHVTSLPPRIDVPDEIWDALERLLSKVPDERPSAGDAAASFIQLAKQFAPLQALAPAPQTSSFDEVQRPATVHRDDLLEHEEIPEYVSPLPEDTPVLGDSPQPTVSRQMPKKQVPVIQPSSEGSDAEENSGWFTKKNILLGAVCLVLVAGLGVGAFWMFSRDGEPAGSTASASEIIQATQKDPTFPTGLSVSRSARFDPGSQEISLEITYATQKAPLAGNFLEVVPGLEGMSGCPAVTWSPVQASRHQALNTGINVDCGWTLEGLQIPGNREVTVTASFPASVKDSAELQKWLSEATSATTEALTDPDVVSTVYPVQRLQNIRVVTPYRAVTQEVLQVVLVPVWPSGPDELNPLYKSPSDGAPSKMLDDIAGSEKGIRFSANCGGAIGISSDGLNVTALSMTPGCIVSATVGNFTDLESSPIKINTRG